MIVITGATGTVGRPLVALLKDQGVAVRAVTRSAEVGKVPAGVDVHRADLARPEDVAPALEGASALFVHPRAVGESAAKLLALAAEKGCGEWWCCRRSTSTTIRSTSRRD